jgi:predicted  nucleic acid-binding Zn-ribbon protein
MGLLFAERKQAWLDNALYNQYFWYSFWVTGLLILSWFAIAWIHNDRVRATWELAECASDALRYSEYCKREAKEAIRRHNDHIEKCNRIIEDYRSGLMTTPETAHVKDLKRDIKRLVADNDTLTKHNERLIEEKEQKAAEFHALSQRVEEVAKHLQATNGASKNPNTALVERIARLEGENRRLQQQLTRKANTKTTVLNGEPNSGE